MPDFAFRSLFEALAPLLRTGGAIERAQGAPVETLWQTGCTPVDDLGIDLRARSCPAPSSKRRSRRRISW